MKKTVLVIDDDVYCLKVAAGFFLEKGFTVTSSLKPSCPMVEQNLTKCPTSVFGYDIIFSDNRMPDMTGLEFFDYQRQRGCKILPEHKALISGDISPQDQAIAESRGYKVFHKPTPLDLIDDWIDEILDKKI